MIAGAEHCGPGGCKLRIAGVSKVFDGRRGKVVALEGINLNIRGGEFVCLVGASGCGKTSLLNIIAGLEFPSSGVVELDGEPVTGPGRDRTVMFQESARFRLESGPRTDSGRPACHGGEESGTGGAERVCPCSYS